MPIFSEISAWEAPILARSTGNSVTIVLISSILLLLLNSTSNPLSKE